MGGKHSRGTASCVAATWQEMMCSTPHAYWDCKLSLGHLLWRGRQSSTSCWCVTTTILHIPQTPPPSLSSSLCLCGRGSRWKPKVMGAFWNCILPFCLFLSLVSSCCLCTQPGLFSQPLCLSSSELGLITLWEVLLQSSAFRIWNLFLPVVWSFFVSYRIHFFFFWHNRAEWIYLGSCFTSNQMPS